MSRAAEPSTGPKSGPCSQLIICSASRCRHSESHGKCPPLAAARREKHRRMGEATGTTQERAGGRGEGAARVPSQTGRCPGPERALRTAREEGRVDRGLEAVTEVLKNDSAFWQALASYARQRNLLFPEDERALVPAVNRPKMVPTERQAELLMGLLSRCEQSGFAVRLVRARSGGWSRRRRP